MKLIAKPSLLVVFLLVVSGFSFGGHKHTELAETQRVRSGEIIVQPNEVVLETQGIVCSFCAYGAKKKLKKLDFIDFSAGKDEAIVTDIHRGLMTVKVMPDQPVDIKGIAKAVKKAGYKLVGVHMRLSGTLTAEENQYFLTSDSSGQRFEISGDALSNVEAGKNIDIQAHLDEAQIASQPKDEGYRFVVDTVTK